MLTRWGCGAGEGSPGDSHTQNSILMFSWEYLYSKLKALVMVKGVWDTSTQNSKLKTQNLRTLYSKL
jgi:hypothetical protein